MLDVKLATLLCAALVQVDVRAILLFMEPLASVNVVITILDMDKHTHHVVELQMLHQMENHIFHKYMFNNL